MSIQGKAIAKEKMALRVAIAIVNAGLVATKMVGIHGTLYMMNTKSVALSMSSRLDSTPHQHFNAKGKIDKRKVRKYERNRGVKVHTSRILRPMTKDRVDSEYMDMLHENRKKIRDAMCVPSELIGLEI